MIFGDTSISKALGLILAHTMHLPSGTLKKGHILSTTDIQTLKNEGIEKVCGARLEKDDVAENEAALALGQLLMAKGLSLSEPYTGRCNIFSVVRGIIIPDQKQIDRINQIDEGMTLGTLEPFSQIEPGQMVATVKVIPFALPKTILDKCLEIANNGKPLLKVAPFHKKRVGFIQTRLSRTKESMLDSTTQTLVDRLTPMNGELIGEIRCNHVSDEICEAIRHLCKLNCEMVLIAGASAIVDRRDIVPTGIIKAGGNIDHFGMPVDPGNLLLLAHMSNIDIIGLPGCARSPKLNGFDWILRRRFADIPITKEDIMKMGTGGLLMEIASRPLPRTSTQSKLKSSHSKNRNAQTKIAAIVLAAGQSRRMGNRNKLLIELDRKPMITHVVNAVIDSGVSPIIVVTGYEHDKITKALHGYNVKCVINPSFNEGISTSIRLGLSELSDDIDGTLICLGDMPNVETSTMKQLISSFNSSVGPAICVPTYKGKRGNPVLWSSNFFTSMKQIAGDVGAKHIIAENSDAVYEVSFETPEITIDVDTPDALYALEPSNTMKEDDDKN